MRATFYRRLWRFNAIIIAAVGVLSLTGLAALSLFGFSDIFVAPRYAANHRLGPEANGGNPLVLGHGNRVDDTTLYAFILGRPDDGSGGSYSSYRKGDDRNILVVNVQDGTSRTILPDNRRRIVEWQTIGDHSTGEARAYVAQVWQPMAADTPASKRRSDILVGNFRTAKQQWVARGVRSLEQAIVVGDNSVGLLTVEKAGLTFRRIDLATLAPSLTSPVPIDSAAPD